MKKIILSLFLVLSMVVSMAVPAMADYDYLLSDVELELLLIPSKSEVKKGETVTVSLIVNGYVDDDMIDAFDFYSFTERITFNDDDFEYVEDSADTMNGFSVDDGDAYTGKLYLTSDDEIEGIESGDILLTFELKAIRKNGDAELAQPSKYLTAKYSRYSGTYDVYTENGDLESNNGTYSDGEYTITVNYDEDQGEVVVTEDTAEEGDEIWIYVTPEDGYELDTIEVFDDDNDEVDLDTDRNSYGVKYYYFEMPASDVVIEVDFDPDGSTDGDEYKISFDYDADFGFAYLNTTTAEDGDRVKVYVELDDDDYTFDIIVTDSDDNEITVNEHSTGKYYYFTMPDDDVEVYVAIDGEDTSTDKYSIDYSYDSDEGTVTAPSKASEDALVRFHIIPEDGYDVEDNPVVRSFDTDKKLTTAKWDSDGYYYFTMPDEKVFVEIEFEKTGSSSSSSGKEYKVEVGFDEDHGDVRLSAEKAEKGDKVKVWIEPGSKYKTDDIEVTEDKTGDDVKFYGDADDDYIYFYMPKGDVYVYVDFVKTSGSSSSQYDIDLDYTSSQGSVDISRDTASKGKTVYIYPSPKAGYTLDDITVYKTSSSKTTVKVYEEEDDNDDVYYSFTMPGYDVTVEVEFAKKSSTSGDYKVTIDSSITNGSVESTASKADKGDKVELTVTPDDGYEVDAVTVTRDTNGTAITVVDNKDGTYSFTMPSTRVTVDVTFKKTAVKTYDITVDSAVKNGTVKTSVATAESGAKITVTLTPATGYTAGTLTVTKGTAKTAVSTTKNTNGTYTFTMPAEKVTVSATFNKNLTPGAHVCAAKSYKDVDTSATSWYHEAADYVISNGYMGSTSTEVNTFEPGTETSRGMIITVLWRLAGKPLSAAEIPYTDVAAGQWYTEAIRWASEKKLLDDIATSGAIEPNASLTREQIASIIYRYIKLNGGGYSGIIQVDLTKFKDANEISGWAIEALAWCNENGVLKGDNTTAKLMPKGNVTRAQFAQILLNYANLEK